jgi:DNA gyrase subunit A
MIKIQPGETIKAMLTISKDDIECTDKFLVLATRRGFIKKTPLAAFKNLRKGGIRALIIEEDDDLIGAEVSHGNDEIILATKKGMACRFSELNLRPTGRSARGSIGMRFKIDGDEVVSMAIVPSMDEISSDEDAAAAGGPEMLVVSDGGMGKRSYVSTYRKTNRGAKGVVNMKLKENESVIAALIIDDSHEILLTTLKGLIVRIPANEIRTIGRASKGVRIMRLKNGDSITGVAKIINVDDEKNDSDAQDTAPDEEIQQIEQTTAPESESDQNSASETE